MLSHQQLDEMAFFILSILCIRDNPSLEEINTFVAYTGREVTLASMRFLNTSAWGDRGDNRCLAFCPDRAGPGGVAASTGTGQGCRGRPSVKLGAADAQALKVLLKRLIVVSDPGLPDLWAPR
jgi:3-hydroxy-9,10-secoandrosta-1,3,5(10)-triene-9,17-dione monooxygenase reductase component